MSFKYKTMMDFTLF